MPEKPKSLSAGEIHKRLDRIDARIGKEDAAVLHRELDEIFQYKPVDNHYFLVRGRLYFSEGKYYEVDMTLAAKENWWMPSPYSPMLAELMYETRIASGTIGLKRYAIVGYYACMGAMSGWNKGRKVHYHDAFFKMVRDVYQSEKAERKRLEEAFCGGTGSEREGEIFDKLADCYWNLCQPMQYIAAKMASAGNIPDLEVFGFQNFIEDLLNIEPNMGYFVRQVAVGRQEECGFLLIVSPGNRTEQHTMARLLKAVGCKCTVLEQPIAVDLDYMVDIRETVEISMSNTEEKDDARVIYPCALYLNDEFVGDNKAELITALLGQTRDTYINVIADRSIFAEEGFHCLTEYKGEIMNDGLCFGYVGDYAAYLSRIFSYDYRKQLGRESKCKFSVIIPARNSAYTLQYTLKTCLNQRGMAPGEYEIIISDNSSKGNTEVETLVKRLGDSRIKYYKTPMELPLAKSFEYAYGMAEGEYILTLGSDDGLLPWCFEVLKEMAAKYPDQNVIGWGRGFFSWTESKLPERGKFVIPGYFKKGEYNDCVFDCHELLKERLDQDGEFIYAMPLIYINSVCKRKFLLKLLDETGTLLDSYTQDLGLGAKVLLIAEKFVYLNYSLSIAGMSDNSLGAKMVKQISSDEEANIRLQTMTERGAGNTVMQAEFPFWPVTTTEGMFWAEVFRLRKSPACNAILSRLLEGHDWKRTLYNLTVRQNIGDVGCFLTFEKIRYSAYCIGEDFGRWYDGELYHLLSDVAERVIQEPKDTDYAVGFIFDRGLALDAGKFGVSNIEEAVGLFENIVNL